MKAIMEIDCETVGELVTHLRVAATQVKKEVKKWKLNPDDQLTMEVTVLEDNNCYGTHKLTITQEE